MSHILDKILEELGSLSYNFVKLGYYADPITNKLILMTELISDEYQKYKNVELTQEKGMEHIVDYYEKTIGRANLKVLRFEFCLYPILNGIHNSLFMHDYSVGDIVEIETSYSNCGYISFEEYMHFLLNAYKYEFVMLDSRFIGNWLRFDRTFCIR